MKLTPILGILLFLFTIFLFCQSNVDAAKKKRMRANNYTAAEIEKVKHGNAVKKAEKKAKKAKRADQCQMGFHKGWNQAKEAKKQAKNSNARKNVKNNAQLRRGNARSCRWDLKPYFNNRKTYKEPHAYVCQALIVSMAIETAYAMKNKPSKPYDISVQAILDCFVPDKCFKREGKLLEGCSPRDVLNNMLKNFEDDSRAYGIYLNKKDYHRQFDDNISKKQDCEALKSESKWASGYFNYKLWLSKENLLKKMPKKRKSKRNKAASNQINLDRHVLDTSKSPSIQVMMNLLKNGPFIAITKISKRLEEYRLESEHEINDLSKAFDMEFHQEEKVGNIHHTFFVIGYVKPQKSNEIYFLVKTCIFAGEGAWGWGGKGFMKMKTATGGPYEFNSEIYQVMLTDTNPNALSDSDSTNSK